METRTRWALTSVAAIAWALVAGYGYQSTKVDDGDSGAGSYTLYMLALTIGAALIVAASARATQTAGRPRLRKAGLVVGGVGILATIVAWALPLWMTLLAVALTMVAVASGPRGRRAVAALAAGQVVGLVALFAGIAAEVGERDEYGDYPAAGGIALIVTAIVTIVALIELTRRSESPLVRQHDASLALGSTAVE
jgi:hypothetical protein